MVCDNLFNETDIQNIINELIEKTHDIFSDLIDSTIEIDEKQKKHKAHWTERHRLYVLLDALNESKKKLPDTVVAPWYIAEIKTTLYLVNKWKDKPIWKEIEPSLQSPTHFNHTILKLAVAECLDLTGHKVNIVPRGDESSPDLMLQAKGGTEDLVYIECYQPISLSGNTSNIAERGANRIIKRSMEKAKEQLDQLRPGILAICGYNQSDYNIKVLNKLIKARLQKTKRPHLSGILIFVLGVKFNIEDNRIISLNSIISSSFIRNPFYFGSVDFRTDTPDKFPKQMDGPLADIKVDNQIFKIGIPHNLSPIKKVSSSSKSEKMLTKLSAVPESSTVDRTILFSTVKKFSPFFYGTGNIDYLCKECNNIIAKSIWYFSLSNIIIKCSVCEKYIEFPYLPDHNFKWVSIPQTKLDITKTIKLSRNIQVKGL